MQDELHDASERQVKMGSIMGHVTGHMSHVTPLCRTLRCTGVQIQPWLQGQDQASATVPQVLLDMHQLWQSWLIIDSGLEIRGHRQDARSLIQSLPPFL